MTLVNVNLIHRGPLEHATECQMSVYAGVSKEQTATTVEMKGSSTLCDDFETRTRLEHFFAALLSGVNETVLVPNCAVPETKPT